MTGAHLNNCRQKTLKCINCRPFLMAICALVVVECACVLAELMIDLQGIKFRFENEETEIDKFVSYLRQRYPDVFKAEDMRTMTDVINLLDRSIVLRSPKDLLPPTKQCTCVCPCNDTSANRKINLSSALFESESQPLETLLQPLINESTNSNLLSRLNQTNLPWKNENLTKPWPLFNFSDFLTLSPLSPQPSLFTPLSSESVTNSSFLMLSETLFPESLTFNTWSTSQWSTPGLPTTEVFPHLISSHTVSLTRTSISEKPCQNYNLKSRKFDSHIDPLNVEFLSEPMTNPLLISDTTSEVLHQTSVLLASYMSTGSKETVRGTQQTLLLDGRRIRAGLITSSLSAKTERIIPTSSEKYIIISATPVPSFHIPTRIHNRIVVDRDQVKLYTVKEYFGFTDPDILISSQLLDNNDNLTISKVLSLKTTLDFQSHTLNTAHDYSHFLSILSDFTPALRKLSVKNKILVPLPLNVTTNINVSHTSVLSPIPGSMALSDFNLKAQSNVNQTELLELQPNIKGISSMEAALTANISSTLRPVSLQDIFILEINNIVDSFFLVAEFVPENESVNRTKFIQNTLEYSKIYKASKALHFISLSILSIMVLEVFDAFIVVSSFALDFVFLDSRWYETGKDATTILVLLLPWRVVRIVNSFLMTMKHKHHLQMMNMKRAKKKAELKSAKLQTLLSEIRKDVQLLVALCRANEIEEKDITACLYGKGRRSVTLSAMSTCTSLMLISTLGKDAVQEDDLYGKVFKEALHEGDTEMDAEILQAEEAAIDAAIELDEQLEARRKSRKYKSKKVRVKRSYTMPRRSASVEIPEPDINENSSNIFYVNDGYFNTRSSSPRSSDMVFLSTVPNVTKTASVNPGCSSLNEEDEMQNSPSMHWSLIADPDPDPEQSEYGNVTSLKSLPANGSTPDSLVIFLPEFDEEFEIPFKFQRKQRFDKISSDTSDVPLARSKS